MEPSLFKYIWTHSKKDQILLILLSLASLPLVYVTLELPKRIINLLEGMELPGEILGFEFDRLEFLMVLSFTFLLVVLVSDTSSTNVSCVSRCPILNGFRRAS